MTDIITLCIEKIQNAINEAENKDVKKALKRLKKYFEGKEFHAEAKSRSSSSKSSSRKSSTSPSGKRNGYMFYAMRNRKSVKAELPDLKGVEITKELGRRWKALSDKKKAKYLEMAEEDKKRYERELNGEVIEVEEKKERPKKIKKTKAVSEPVEPKKTKKIKAIIEPEEPITKADKVKKPKSQPNHLWKLIQEFPNKDWDRFEVSKNPAITWEIIRDNPDYKWDPRGVSQNPNITPEIIQANPDYKWDWRSISLKKNLTSEFIEKNLNKSSIRWDYVYLSDNPAITWKIVSKKIDEKWNWLKLMRNPGITWKDIQKNIKFLEAKGGWETWRYISRNPNVTLEIIKDNLKLPWDWHGLSYNPNITWEYIQKNIDKPWNWSAISSKPYITWDMVQAYPTKWVWGELANNASVMKALVKENPKELVNALVKDRKVFKDNIPLWEEVSYSPYLTWDVITSKPVKTWNWPALAKNPNITWENIQSVPESRWADWFYVSQNPNLTYDIIKKNPTKKWDWTGLSENEFELNPMVAKRVRSDSPTESENPKKAQMTVHVVSFKQVDTSSPTEKELDEGLKKLKKLNVNLKWGDLVYNSSVRRYRNDGISIYDGSKLVDLASDIDGYGALPPNFQVLIPHPDTGELIPTTYWHPKETVENTPIPTGIAHNDMVWFDQRPYVKELMENVTQDNDKFGTDTIYTYFHINGKKYYIIMEKDGEYDKDSKKTFKQILKAELAQYFNCRDNNDEFKTGTKRVLFAHKLYTGEENSDEEDD